tara:strand:- start:319 stop:1488 length:1170 start_codon:yes stop_codon:yes gene_type:complete
MEYTEHVRTSIIVVDNYLTAFPISEMYNLNPSNITFSEAVDSEDGGVVYNQSGGFQLNKILPTDNYIRFLNKDWRVIIKDNNGFYRMIGLHTGVKFKFNKDNGGTLNAFNGTKFTFSTKEEITAPFMDSLDVLKSVLKFTVNTDLGTGDTFTIPTSLVETYNYSVTTEDGYSASNITGDHTITFPTGGGVHTISIEGAFPKFYFHNLGDKEKITIVNNWGGIAYSLNQQNAFWGCVNLTSIADDIEWINSVTNCSSMFRDNNLTSLPSVMTLESLDSGATMFTNNNLTTLPSGIKLASLTNGAYMFYQNSLISLPSGIKLASLTNGAYMFLGNTINTTRYSELLVDLESGNTNNGVIFHGGNSEYNTTGETARDLLVVRTWTITDGGLE